MRKVQDHYFKKAKKEGYLARSVYKLQEADRKYNLFSKGEVVVDLGAAPGSWTQYVAGRVGDQGKVVAVDIHMVKVSSPNVLPLRRDVHELDADELRREMTEAFHVDQVDGLISDMAPKTTGNKGLDHLRSIALAEKALLLATAILKPDGIFFCKVFQGAEFNGFLASCRSAFREVKVFKPKSSRKESVEVFILGRGLSDRAGANGPD